MGTYCGLTPGRYLHEGDSVSGDGNLGACMSLTAHRGAHELPGIVSSCNNASASLAQCRDNAGQNKKPVHDTDSDLSLPDKSGDAFLFSVPNVEHDMLTSENMSSRVNSLSFLYWNVNGLLSKTQDSEFVSYVCSFDFVCIVETFVEDFQSDVFHGYNVFCKPAVKFTRQGRHSGGVICLVERKKLYLIIVLCLLLINVCRPIKGCIVCVRLCFTRGFTLLQLL